tara:strand:+ start:214 stop:441 length:228 start_codon:yes stop_codon:yes gene_type:complete
VSEMLRLHMTLGMLDCLDDVIEVVQDLEPERRRGVDEIQLKMLADTVYEKKLDIDRIERWSEATTQEGDDNETGN